MDPGTQPPPGAVAVVVTLGVGGRVGQLSGGTQRNRGMARGIEGRRGGGRDRVVV